MPVELCWPLTRAPTDARTRLAQTLPVYTGLLHPREIVRTPDVVLCTALAPLLVFLRGGVGRNERLRASLGVGLVLGVGLSTRRGLLLIGCLGPRALTGCPPLVCIQPLFDGDCHHHGPNNNHCSSYDCRRRKDAERYAHGHGSRSRRRRGDSAFSCDITKPDPVVLKC